MIKIVARIGINRMIRTWSLYFASREMWLYRESINLSTTEADSR